MEYAGQEYAEVCFVPEELAKKKYGPVYRYLAIREMLEQPIVPGMEEQLCLPFPTVGFGWAQYKLFRIVANRYIPAAELIWWRASIGPFRGECGLVSHHDPCVEPQRSHEVSGIGGYMGE
jgi:hypothetical protein